MERERGERKWRGKEKEREREREEEGRQGRKGVKIQLLFTKMYK